MDAPKSLANEGLASTIAVPTDNLDSRASASSGLLTMNAGNFSVSGGAHLKSALEAVSTTTSAAPSATTTGQPSGSAQSASGISLVAFVTALVSALIVFGIQMGLFFLLRNKLSRIFKPKTYLVPERERTDPPPASPWHLFSALVRFSDREIIKKCGLDAYFFSRYLQTLLVIFIPIALIVIPILIPINYVGGLGHDIVNSNQTNTMGDTPQGLDTLAWGNVTPENQGRRWAHLILALAVIVWVCAVFFYELRIYIKVRQDYLTSAEHRLRASANTVLVSSIPEKWLSEEALRGLFDVFPGGLKGVFLSRDFTTLLEKIRKRDAIHEKLEAAESELIRMAKKKQLKRREDEENKARKASKVRAISKAERAQRNKDEDERARKQAEESDGISTGAQLNLPHGVVAAVDQAEEEQAEKESAKKYHVSGTDSTGLGGGLTKVGHGLGQGLKHGVSVVVGGSKLGAGRVSQELAQTGGFIYEETSRTQSSDRPKMVHIFDHLAPVAPVHSTNGGRRISNPSVASAILQDSIMVEERVTPRQLGNTTRKVKNIDSMYVTEETQWWQFWKPPTGGYASPVPQGSEGSEYPFRERVFWQRIKAYLPFIGDKNGAEGAYRKANNFDLDEEKEEGAVWSQWVKEKDRPTHRLARFEWTPAWLPGLPLLNKKVDTIYWCRAELARLNLEIEEDQRNPGRYKASRSAFIQFNNQVAAHMACQAVTHHLPRQMAPRVVEISPDDIIWDNMAIGWSGEWLRSAIVFCVVVGMGLLWAIPVAWTASLSQIDALIVKYPWLHWLEDNKDFYKAVKGIAGVLPAVVLSLLLALVPFILQFLADFQGSKTGAQKAEVVQSYYFAFLFVQVFLVVSITSGAWQTLADITGDVSGTPALLAKNLPKAANYFFSYMILQALSTSSGTLLQVGTLFMWYVWARMTDDTARSKWRRNTDLPGFSHATLFPVYTNFACISLIYCIVAPLISLFSLITFSLLWSAIRYNMLYVTRFKTDTGGILYPRAINQTFTGLYVMELCLIGLFFLARDERNRVVCYPQGIITVIAMVFTALYQYLLNRSFSPLFRYLPITFEDEAVLRDEAFSRAQARRLGLVDDDDDEDEHTTLSPTSANGSDHGRNSTIELRGLDRRGRIDTGGSSGATSRLIGHLKPVRGMVQARSWAARGGRQIKARTLGKAEENLRKATEYRKLRRQRDLEAQRAIGEALYGGFSDEIEDLTPEERDALVHKAFQHYALRARRPTVWIPRDDIGVSDDEIRRTRAYSEHIWISNEGTALDSNVRVVYGRHPPDFSEVDLINL